MVEVTQSARDAAATLVEWHNTAASEWHIEGGSDLRFFAADMPEGIKRGIWDEHPFVQAFAAAEQRGGERQRERDAKVAENHFGDRADMQSYAAAGQRIAQAIRQEPTT